MPTKITIPPGTRVGMLTVLGESPTRVGRNFAWLCRCDCGGSIAVTTGHLLDGHNRSCGCLRRQLARASLQTHGMSHLPEYSSWSGMRSRCLNPTNPHYASYGGRGITLCLEWDSFAVFYRDMGPRPTPRHSLDRIDNNGPYNPSNCRWATQRDQNRNRRSTRMLTWQGWTLAVSDWAEVLGIPLTVLIARLGTLRNGSTIDQVLGAPYVARVKHHRG